MLSKTKDIQKTKCLKYCGSSKALLEIFQSYFYISKNVKSKKMKNKFDSFIIIVKCTSHLPPNTKSKTIKAINVITVIGSINNVEISYTKMSRKIQRKHIILFVPDVNIYLDHRSPI